MDILDLEAGVARPGRDYSPTRGGFIGSPMPGELGLSSLIDAGHSEFNGRSACLASAGHQDRTLVGVRIGSDVPAPFTELQFEGRSVGHTLSSAYSPAMRCALAFAMVETKKAAPGTRLSLRIRNRTNGYAADTEMMAQICNLPFFASSAQSSG
jgi:glycine cleavage system aminomethyltransferase T